ncbi:MAG TPA: hypothetical protein VFX51_05110 [Solirubrobacteraceae bacterium]|nr:hypothetical protein [Solirubrobacteraceae bacterium]
MRRLAALACVLVAGLASAAPARASFTDADYWAFADRQMAGLDHRWRGDRLAYTDENGHAEIRENAAMLLTHAIAAYTGHTGPTRQDARARVLVDRLTAPPAWLGTGPAPAPTQSTCWSVDLDQPLREHMSLEPKVADALAWAWRARAQLKLPTAAVQRIVAEVAACAGSPAWRYPRRLTNQINWNAEMYAAAATVTGDPGLLVNDYRLQLADFAGGITRPMAGMKSANLGPGYEFHYRPDHRDSASSNLDTPEYANITIQALSFYEPALRLGMAPLSDAQERRLRSWMLRLLAGSWTHAGYLNWDTARGFRRWHSGQYWAFAQQGLQTIATTPRFWRTPAEGAWAKSMFDQGLVLYRRLADESADDFAPRLMFGIDTRMKSSAFFRFRILASAARAIALGMGSQTALEPPPLWAYDYDAGRLAITTPRYSTAIVPDDRDVLGYGGIELARLFGPGQRVASGTGGRPPGAFGVVVSGGRGRVLLTSQRPRDGARLRVVRSPAGNLARPRAYPRAPYAGAFGLVEARGRVQRSGARVDSRYVFRRETIAGRWDVRCRRVCARVRAFFPTWSDEIVAVLRSGERVRVDRTPVAVADVRSVVLGGYRLARLTAPPGATLVAVPVAGEPTNPTPGPSLAVQIRGRPSARVTALVEPLG